MPQVVYSANAIENLERLHSFLAERNPKAAVRAIRTIRSKLKILARFPRIAPVDPDEPDYRDLFIPFGATGYLARYRIAGRLVVIVAIRHALEAGYLVEE